VRSNDRSQITVSALLSTFLLGSSALAVDYSVDYGVDTVSAGKDAGSLTCQLKRACNAKIESLGLNVSVSIDSKKSREVVVKLENDDLTCCYFSGGGRSATVNAHEKLSRLPFFKGAAPRGGLFIENEQAGILYLRFDLQ
jgi:hypothetical protein